MDGADHPARWTRIERRPTYDHVLDYVAVKLRSSGRSHPAARQPIPTRHPRGRLSFGLILFCRQYPRVPSIAAM